MFGFMVPAEHDWQLDWPTTLLNVPTAQLLHCEGSVAFGVDEKEPAGQGCGLTELAAQNEPMGQGNGLFVPADGQYAAAGQCKHTDWSMAPTAPL